MAKFVQNPKIMAECKLKSDKQLQAGYKKQISLLDPLILALGLSQPALRALVNLEVNNVSDLKRLNQETIYNSHGIGPKAYRKLETLF